MTTQKNFRNKGLLANLKRLEEHEKKEEKLFKRIKRSARLRRG